MSTDTFEAEIDNILGELTTDFTKKRKETKPSSASSTFYMPHDIGAISETLRTIMDCVKMKKMNPKGGARRNEHCDALGSSN